MAATQGKIIVFYSLARVHAYHTLQYIGETENVEWQNAWDGPLKVTCGDKESIHKVKSHHRDGYKDRQWRWDCHTIAKVSFDHCYWTDVNDFDEPSFKQCAPKYVISGVESYHSNKYEDRRWKIYCCKAPNHFTRNCHYNFLMFTDNEMQELCYLRAQLRHCGDLTYLDVMIDDVVRHSTRLNNNEFVCLPVYCDESRSSIVGQVTVSVPTTHIEPRDGFSGDVMGLFSLESECQKEGSEFVVITCQSEEESEGMALL